MWTDINWDRKEVRWRHTMPPTQRIILVLIGFAIMCIGIAFLKRHVAEEKQLMNLIISVVVSIAGSIPLAIGATAHRKPEFWNENTGQYEE